MQILITVAMAAVAAMQTPASAAPTTRSAPLLVRSVIDGNTIDVGGVGRVRLLGIDAPKIGRGSQTAAPFGREARDRLSQLVLRRWVRLEQEGGGVDLHRHHLAYVLTEDGQCVNAVLVREGLARVSARAPLSRLPELQRAEAEARMFRRNLWGSAPALPATGYTRPSSVNRPPTSRTKTPASKRRKTRKRKS
jgi:micrococcal nuclease